jgi:Protein of unknown function (DUF3089)
MKKQISVAVFFALFLCLALAGCNNDGSLPIPAATYPIDYSKPENWLSLPSIGGSNKAVDVFYVYPTEYFAGPNGPIIGPIDDPNIVAGAQQAFGKQATAFAAVGNIFAPYYRQADAVYALTSQIDPTSSTSVILCHTVNPTDLATNIVFTAGVYHNYDYPFYYNNIAANAANRGNRFLTSGN